MAAQTPHAVLQTLPTYHNNLSCLTWLAHWSSLCDAEPLADRDYLAGFAQQSREPSRCLVDNLPG